MAKFRYKAVDSQGKEVLSTVEADSQGAAIEKIRAMKLTPKAIGMVKEDTPDVAATRPAPAAKPKKRSGEIKLPKFMRGSVKTKDLMIFTRQLATLVDAGLPLLRGLRVLHRQTTNEAMKEALAGMLETVETGNTFSESLANYPKIFNNLYVNMVKAGEAGGVLETVLNRLAEFMEKAEKIKNKVKGAMTYPIVVLTAAVGIVVFLMLAVIPKFQQIFDDLMGGEGMPALTQFVIDLSEWVQEYWMFGLAVVVALVVGIKIFKKTPMGSYLSDVIALKAPGFGELTQKTVVARLTRTLGTLLSSGVPVLQALGIVKDTTGNQVIAKALQSVHDSVKEGEGMTAPLGASGAFPPMVVSMVEVGEETGALPEMLIRVANTYDDEVDNAVAAMTSIIEPIMIIFLAVVVGGIVIAMFMPLISIIGTIGQQGS
ncbi:MAG: type II secretion system F family protein [Kiritimatiellae bacterium]|nr:type II secretion system F family protein [Kiritimatiellia bacterium]